MCPFNPDQYLAEKTPPPEMGTLERYGRGLVNELPTLGGMTGGAIGGISGAAAGGVGAIPGGLAGAGIGGYLGTASKNLINSYIDPEQAPKTTGQALLSPVVGGAEQVAYQGAGEIAGPYLKAGLSKISEPLSSYLSKLAEKRAVAATGATGVQAAKFAPNTGRELLDRGIVKFGSSPANIAKNAGAELEKSGQGIGSALKSFDQSGARVSRDSLIQSMQGEAEKLSNNPAMSSAKKQIQGIIEDIEAGPESYSLSDAEQVKRDFQSKVNWNTPETNPGNRAASGTYRQAVEDVATKENPELASQFKADKETYGLLSPVQEAAEKRATQLNQSPHGGLLDITSIGGGGGIGATIGGPAGAVVGGAAGYAAKTLRPRYASMAAVGSNWLSNIVKETPTALGRWAGPLTQAANRGGNALPIADFLLQQRDPGYQAHIRDLKATQEEAKDALEE